MATLDKNRVQVAAGDTVRDDAGTSHTVALLGHFVIQTTRPVDHARRYLRANTTVKQ